jgi:hypothetical protein
MKLLIEKNFDLCPNYTAFSKTPYVEHKVLTSYNLSVRRAHDLREVTASVLRVQVSSTHIVEQRNAWLNR